jgi:hypothetical protein
MIVLLIFAIVALALLIFRTYRLVQYFKEADRNPTAKGRRIAFINFGIHLFVCLAILYYIIIAVYGMGLFSNE